MNPRHEDEAAGRDRPASRDDLYGISLDLLHDLLRQWRDLWATVAKTMEDLPADVQASLQELPADPMQGLHRAAPQFAQAFHPDVVAFLVSNLDAAAATVEQLHEEQRTGTIHFAGYSTELEDRVQRLESLLGGVSAVLGTIAGPADQRRPD